MSEEELAALKIKLTKERRATRRAARGKTLPSFDPTDPAVAAAATGSAAAGKEEQGGEDSKGSAKPEKARMWLRRQKTPPAPAAEPDVSPAPTAPAEQPAAEQQPPQAVPPIPAPHVNGGSRPGNGTSAPHHNYREQVESELQRILDDAGLHTEVDGILADARAEAQRQGVPIDSELMLRALCEDTTGAGKLSDSTKGELESRFKRIVAEERGERGPTPGSQPPQG